jgi:NADH-quinone oxidoreductase subunit M
MLYPYEPLMLSIIMLPIVSSILIYFVGIKTGIDLKYAAVLTMIFVFILSLMLIPVVQDNNIYKVLYEPVAHLGKDGSQKISLDMRVDSLSLIVLLLTSLVTTLAMLFSIQYNKKREMNNSNSHYACMLLFAAGMFGVLFSTDMIQFYLFWELMLIPSYLLVTYWGEDKKHSQRIGLKYFIYTHIGAVLILIGILFTIALTGKTDMETAGMYLGTKDANLIKITASLFIIGFGIKMAIFPFHSWLPDTYSNAPLPVSVMLAGAMSAIGVYGLVRFLFTLFTRDILVSFTYVILIAAIITQFYGAIMALVERNTKRILAYSSISQAGYIFFGIGTVVSIGVGGSMLHAVNSGLIKALLFMVVGSIILMTGIRYINQLGGLANKMPFTAFAASIGVLALAAIPPMNGFVSEWMILAGGFGTAYTVLAVLAVIAGIFTMAYSLRFVKEIFFGELPKNLEATKETSLKISLILAVLVLLCVVIGIVPTLVTGFIKNALTLFRALGGW